MKNETPANNILKSFFDFLDWKLEVLTSQSSGDKSSYESCSRAFNFLISKTTILVYYWKFSTTRRRFSVLIDQNHTSEKLMIPLQIEAISGDFYPSQAFNLHEENGLRFRTCRSKQITFNLDIRRPQSEFSSLQIYACQLSKWKFSTQNNVDLNGY